MSEGGRDEERTFDSFAASLATFLAAFASALVPVADCDSDPLDDELNRYGY